MRRQNKTRDVLPRSVLVISKRGSAVGGQDQSTSLVFGDWRRLLEGKFEADDDTGEDVESRWGGEVAVDTCLAANAHFCHLAVCLVFNLLSSVSLPKGWGLSSLFSCLLLLPSFQLAPWAGSVRAVGGRGRWWLADQSRAQRGGRGAS